MAMSPPQEITQLLNDWSNGDQAALAKLMPLVYEELRRRAHNYMRNERAGHTLQTTELVHEAYLKLVDYRSMRWQKRAHFFAVAAQVMRRVLVEQARGRQRGKRGGDAIKVALDEGAVLLREPSLELLPLDEALTKLAGIDFRKSQVVEMRFFGGMSNEEIAEVLKISPNTVTRDWKFAEAWLRRELCK